MSYGFVARNVNNQVLVSSDTRNLHFIGKYIGPSVEHASDFYGGIRRYKYTVTCNVTPVPFFTTPTEDFYGITGVRNVGGDQWEIEIVRSGTSGLTPELYVFADPRGATPTETHGMLVYRDDGTPSFDSRMRPLAVTGGFAVTHPANPRPSFPYTLSADNCGSMGSSAGGFFEPTQYNTYWETTPAKPMFHYSSLAQAEREAYFDRRHRACSGFDAYGGCIGYDTEEHWESWYWCFYRGGIARKPDRILAGWMACFYGCHWSYTKDSSFIGIGVGGSGGTGGTWPYSNETLNLSSTAVIVADASRYD